MGWEVLARGSRLREGWLFTARVMRGKGANPDGKPVKDRMSSSVCVLEPVETCGPDLLLVAVLLSRFLCTSGLGQTSGFRTSDASVSPPCGKQRVSSLSFQPPACLPGTAHVLRR